jgi:hypothetical protein
MKRLPTSIWTFAQDLVQRWQESRFDPYLRFALPKQRPCQQPANLISHHREFNAASTRRWEFCEQRE